MSVSRLALSLLLLGLLLGIYWFSRDPALPRQAGTEQVPDYYAENLVMLEMNEQGKPYQRLAAERMEHYAHDHSMHLREPRLLMFEPGLPPWRLRAETGWIAGDRQQAWLRGPVFIDRTASASSGSYQMNTRDLRLTRAPDYAETAAPVSLRTDRDRIDAIGMQVWFEPALRIEFLSQVRGTVAQTP